MTHNADCAVEDKETIDNIAECYAEAGGLGQPKSGSRTKCRELAEKNGLENIGAGTSREVFLVEEQEGVDDGQCVIKFAFNRQGVSQNWNEWELWDEDSFGGIRQYLVPVKDFGDLGRWISMSRFEPMNTKEAAEEVEENIEDIGWECADIIPQNVGKSHGNLRLLDYGEGCFPTRLVDPEL